MVYFAVVSLFARVTDSTYYWHTYTCHGDEQRMGEHRYSLGDTKF